MLDAAQIAALSWEPVTGQPGVRVKKLWSDPRDGSVAGVMQIDPGSRVTKHMHHYSIHHVWVTEGTCIVRGRALGPGAYCFVPAGIEHGIDTVSGRDRCTILYLYLRAEML